MLKAYTVDAGDNDYSFHESCLVYHENPEAARELGRGALSSGPSYNETRAIRAPQHDHRAMRRNEPEIEEDDEYLRSQGWAYEGEEKCSSCGLAAFGNEEFAVCKLSGLCKVCTCDDGEDPPCNHAEGFSCE